MVPKRGKRQETAKTRRKMGGEVAEKALPTRRFSIEGKGNANNSLQSW